MTGESTIEVIREAVGHVNRSITRLRGRDSWVAGHLTVADGQVDQWAIHGSTVRLQKSLLTRVRMRRRRPPMRS